MRLNSEEIDYLARRILKSLVAEGKIQVDDENRVAHGLAAVLSEELSVEDRLNEEVRAMLSEHQSQMERQDITYTEMFKALKRKLAKEKGIVL